MSARLVDALQADHLQPGAIDEERNAVEVADADEVGAVLDQRDEPLALGLEPRCARDVARDLRGAHHVAAPRP